RNRRLPERSLEPDPRAYTADLFEDLRRPEELDVTGLTFSDEPIYPRTAGERVRIGDDAEWPRSERRRTRCRLVDHVPFADEPGSYQSYISTRSSSVASNGARILA